MDKAGYYIGTLAGVIVCVEQKRESGICGCFYHAYSREATMFQNENQLIMRMGNFFEAIQFPFPGTEIRTFDKRKQNQRKEKQQKMVSEEELLRHHGENGTFIVRVQHMQNSSWQGLLTWVEEDRTVSFRSVLELLKLIESAVDPDEVNACHLEKSDKSDKGRE